ncbi:hypothetical protein M514_26752 [Trichuris suis]|uniref:Laminin N-terminal domain-containing protein n=1 Tax=Trichuris suis TaxID=68888 RepID=A0A085MV04_9BILA|nr:hypothetical protein M514_26752 [Trichuris suis]
MQVKGGQNCEYCDAANPELRHPAEYMVDGTPRYWQSPPLSRGMDYNKVNITIDLEQAKARAARQYVQYNSSRSIRPVQFVRRTIGPPDITSRGQFVQRTFRPTDISSKVKPSTEAVSSFRASVFFPFCVSPLGSFSFPFVRLVCRLWSP